MKAIIFGSTGKLGRGLVSGLNNSIFSHLHKPLRSDLDLFDSKDLNEYIYSIYPDVIIQAAGLTTNKESSNSKIQEVISYNDHINKNVTKAAQKLKKCIFIDIGSASIYENLPLDEIFEDDFSLLEGFNPSIPYSISKYHQSQNVIEVVKKGYSWYSLILPYVISTQITSSESHLGLFNRISRDVIHAYQDKLYYKLPGGIDGNLLRQFVHGIDVGRFCLIIIEAKLLPGIVHLPNLPFMSLNQFIHLHSWQFKKVYDSKIEDIENTYLHPKLNSNILKVSDFEYQYNSKNLVNELVKNLQY
jgi:nucleoside-diphosphate-sugar epimerase